MTAPQPVSPADIVAEAQSAVATANYKRLREQIAAVLGTQSDLVQAKQISASNQTSPRTGEFSTVLRRYLRDHGDQYPEKWVLVGLLTGSEREYTGIETSLGAFLRRECSVGLIIGSEPAWQARRIYYSPGHKADATKLQTLFGLGAGSLTPLAGDFGPAQAAGVPAPATLEAARAVAPPEGATPYTVQQGAAGLFMNEKEFAGIVDLLKRRKNLIIQGPPGVGKTFLARRVAFSLLGYENEEHVCSVQFHPSYSYEDFIQGYRPKAAGGFDVKPGLFYRFCWDHRSHDTVFIIDEINRANVSKVFGEVLSLIERDKRGEDFGTPLMYAEDATQLFFVPPGLHLMGMMNTADRSLAMVDYALRRRFAFYDLRPAFTEGSFVLYLIASGVSEQLAETITSRMSNLNRMIAEDTKNLGPGYEVGHSYFCPSPEDGPPDRAWYERVVTREIAPLLREYWFGEDTDVAEDRIRELLA